MKGVFVIKGVPTVLMVFATVLEYKTRTSRVSFLILALESFSPFFCQINVKLTSNHQSFNIFSSSWLMPDKPVIGIKAYFQLSLLRAFKYINQMLFNTNQKRQTRKTIQIHKTPDYWQKVLSREVDACCMYLFDKVKIFTNIDVNYDFLVCPSGTGSCFTSAINILMATLALKYKKILTLVYLMSKVFGHKEI